MTRHEARRYLLPALVLSLLLLDGPASPTTVHAAGIVVNTLADASPPTTDGLCSLREAITNANDNTATHPDCAAGAGADAISFTVSGTIVLAAALPDIADGAGLTIDGGGQVVTVSGNNTVRPFTVLFGVTLSLKSMTVTDGYGQARGGAIYAWGGNIILTDATMTRNTVTGFPGLGGAIWTYGGNVTIIRSLVKENTAAGSGGGIHDNGESGGSLTIQDSSISGNTAGNGGDCGVGGGVYASSTVNVIRSTLDSNTSRNTTSCGGWGGGLYINASANVQIVNSTITGNLAERAGAGIASTGTVNVVNSTISDNLSVEQAGGLLVIQGQVTTTNSILAKNHAPQSQDCVGSLSGQAQNLLSELDGCLFTGPAPVSGDPLLGPLADNGGPTKTHALLPGSPAIDAGDHAVCTSVLIGGKDQRGVARPQGLSCDLGSYERIPLPPGPVVHHAADAIQGMNDGERVRQWDDLSGHGRHARQSIKMRRPAFLLDQVNGRAAVRFINGTSGGQWVETVSHGTLSGPQWTFVAVLRPQNPTHGNSPSLGSVYGEGLSTAQGQYSDIRLREEDWHPQWVGNNDVTGEQYIVGNAVLDTSHFHTLILSRSGTLLTALVNGVVVGTAMTTLNFMTPPDRTAIGVLIRSGLSDYLSADLAEVLLYNRALSPAEISLTEAYLSEKYRHYPQVGLAVSNVSLPEGDVGSTPFTFTVSLSAPSATPVTVHVATADGTATAPSDYAAVPDALITFAPGETNKAFPVQVKGDMVFEPNETFIVNLSNPTGAVIADGQGVGTIQNDDIPGGRNLRITTGSIDLSWDGGTAQTSYTLLKYNTSTAATQLISLPGNATSYSDAAAVNGTVYCYVLAALNGATFLGLSDLLCGLTGISSGTAVPVGFGLTPNQTASATMTWTPPAGGIGSYLLQRIPLDGTPISSVPLGAGVTSTTQAVTSAGTCFQLIAFAGLGFGTTNVLCGVPGVSTLGIQPETRKAWRLDDVQEMLTERISAAGLLPSSVALSIPGSVTLEASR